jgi:hypothetical protein
MKKVIFAIFVFLIINPFFLYAQNAKVDNIVNFCKSIDEKIGDEEIVSGYWIHTIKLNTNRSAIGPQTTTIKFYYEQQGDSIIEKNGVMEFLDIYKPPVKIVIEYNIAASQNIKIDYYPDEKGKLIYYHYLTKGAYTNGEEFYYFENGKPVKIKSVELSSENEVLEKYKNFDREKDFTKEDLKKCKKIIKNWDEYKNMFDHMIKIEKLDK